MKKLYLILSALSLIFLMGCTPVKEAVPETTVETVVTEPAAVETQPAAEIPENDDFVDLLLYVPGISVDLRYATDNNFTGQPIYDFELPYLRCGTAQKLCQAAEELAQYGYYLKIWDAFRPVSAQFTLWEVCPDASFVANPNVGFSSHSRGNTVDLTLVDKWGQELEMPSGFDEFSALADRDYSDCSAEAAQNALLLQETMEKFGFSGYKKEWWHFSDSEEYPVEENFDPADALQ